MSDEDLEVLITLDDPEYGPDEDVFHHLQTVTDWPRRSFSPRAEGKQNDSRTSEGLQE